MPKVIVTLLTIGLAACNERLPGSSGAQGVTNFEKLSDTIIKGSFHDIDQLTAVLAKQGVAYTLTPISEDFDVIEPTLCASKVGSNFNFAYLRLEGTTGPKVYRYRIYFDRSGPLCIEEDFGFANPYG
jgi:hypothetical protein